MGKAPTSPQGTVVDIHQLLAPQREPELGVLHRGQSELLRVDHIPIVRHTKVRMDANPYFDTQYFMDRKFSKEWKRLSGRFKQV